MLQQAVVFCSFLSIICSLGSLVFSVRIARMRITYSKVWYVKSLFWFVVLAINIHGIAYLPGLVRYLEGGAGTELAARIIAFSGAMALGMIAHTMTFYALKVKQP
jgi:hypothetical protein